MDCTPLKVGGEHKRELRPGSRFFLDQDHREIWIASVRIVQETTNNKQVYVMAFILRNRLQKTAPLQYLLVGMIIGLVIGICVILPLTGNDITFFTFATNQEYYVEEVGHNESSHNNSIDTTLARKLQEEVKVLCWIMTGPKNHDTKARHVKATWGKRCNYLLFMSTKEDPSLPSIALPVKEDRPNLWGKTKEAFKYVYKHYYDKVDWFFKCDDDTYTIMENLRYMLHYHNTSDPVYFGFRFKPLVKQGYMSGGAGYVLSKEALKRFVVDSLPDPKKCKQQNTGAEDAEMGKCLEAVGVEAGDSRDNEGRSTFLPLFLTSIIMPGKLSKDFWLWKYIYYPFKTGLECCSDNLISVHYVPPENMYMLEYLIYHVKPFGFSYNSTFQSTVFGNDITQNANNETDWDNYT